MTDQINVLDLQDRHSKTAEVDPIINELDLIEERRLRFISKNTSSILPTDKRHVGKKDLEELEVLLNGFIRTSEHFSISKPHRTAAFNALCGFLEQGIISLAPEVRDLCFATSTWERVFKLFIERSEIAKAKPSRQVLMTLVKLLVKNPDRDAVSSLQELVLSRSLAIIKEQKERTCVKPAMQILEIFLNRAILDASRIVRVLPRGNPRGDAELNITTTCKSQVRDVLHWIQYDDIAATSGRLLVSFLKSFHSLESMRQQSPYIPLWAGPLKQVIRETPETIEAVEHHIIPGLLRLDAADSHAFLNGLPLERMKNGNYGGLVEEDIRLVLITINILKESGTSNSSDDISSFDAENSLYNAPNISMTLLEHSSPSVRNAALLMVAHSSSSNRPISAEMLYCLQQKIPFFHAEANTKARNDFLSIMRRLCLRVHGAIIRMRKLDESTNARIPSQNASPSPQSLNDLLNRQIHFVNEYAEFLCSDLQATASYQRHITALKILHYMISIELLGTDLTVVKSGCLFRSLLDLLLDPFDDVRHMAATILKILPPQQHSIHMTNGTSQKSETFHIDLSDILSRAETMMQHTGRADYADGVGRLYDLLFGRCSINIAATTWLEGRHAILEHLLSNLEHDIRVARDSLRLAVSAAPLHGRLISLRYIIGQPNFYETFATTDGTRLDEWRKLDNRLLDYCAEVWNVVKDVLCLDSPEGHVPTDTEEEEFDLGIKDALSFSWRALKEASSLMHTMITSSSYNPSGSFERVQYHVYSKLGGLAFQQLAHLRHRGAFSTVSQTFAACCIRCAGSEDGEIARLPKKWYQDTISCIHDRASTLTRRSAGLPALITGVLAAYSSGTFFDSVILDLEAIAKMPIEEPGDLLELHLPQVHALNCLKDVFTNTQLGLGSECHIAKSLDIAVTCLDKDLWAIQNCGLMLLRALLTRLGGGSGIPSSNTRASHLRSSKFVYEKYPNLIDLLLRLLGGIRHTKGSVNQKSNPLESHHARKVFSSLEIIERAGIPSKNHSLIKNLITSHLESRVWYIRKKVARTLGLIVNDNERLNEIKTFLQLPWSSQNAFHGRLLYIQFVILAGQKHGAEYYEQILSLLIAHFYDYVIQNSCSFTVALYLDIFAHVLSALSDCSSHSVSNKLSTYKEQLWKKWRSSLDALRGSSALPGIDLQIIALARCLFFLDSSNMDQLYEESTVHRMIQDVTQTNAVCQAAVLQVLPTCSEACVWISQILIPCCIHVVNGPFYTETQAFAMEQLADLFSSIGCNSQKALLLGSFLHLAETNILLDRIQNICGGDIRLSNAALRVCGVLLAMEYRRAPRNSKTLDRLRIWLRMLHFGSDERSELSNRLAAADSVAAFQTVLQRSDIMDIPHTGVLGVHIKLLDFLNDDDEEVREKAAMTASWILSHLSSSDNMAESARVPLMPLAAEFRLTNFITLRYHESTLLFYEAVRRLVGMLPSDELMLVLEIDSVSVSSMRTHVSMLEFPKVCDLLAEGRKEDTSLFAEERQNLFIDDLREAEKWAVILQELSQTAIDLDLAHKLRSWTDEGLAVLVENARTKIDGSLGWTTKTKTFMLGMRIILAAELVVTLERRAIMSSGQTMQLLRGLLETGVNSSLHGLWLRRVGGILEKL